MVTITTGGNDITGHLSHTGNRTPLSYCWAHLHFGEGGPHENFFHHRSHHKLAGESTKLYCYVTSISADDPITTQQNTSQTHQDELRCSCQRSIDSCAALKIQLVFFVCPQRSWWFSFLFFLPGWNRNTTTCSSCPPPSASVCNCKHCSPLWMRTQSGSFLSASC